MFLLSKLPLRLDLTGLYENVVICCWMHYVTVLLALMMYNYLFGAAIK